MKKLFAIILVVAMIINPVSCVYADDNSSAESIENTDTYDANQFASGYIPSELDSNAPVYDSGFSLYVEVPSCFPNSLDNLKSIYPDTRNQNPYGTCWAFSSIGLAEFDLINDGMADRDIDLSELQLIYFLFNSVTDPLGGTEGDYARYYNENAQYTYLNYGGNYEMASRRLAQWVGVVPESVVPYSDTAKVLSDGVSDQYAYNADVAHLQNVYRINIRQNTSDVKQQIMEHGAVGIMYYHDDGSLHWNSSSGEYTYYDVARTGGGHAVMVVGWDDNYSKNNFQGTQPTNDGAWLIRNSWGSYADYFWMSYDTVSLMDAAWVFDFSFDDGYDNNYQLDGGIDSYSSQFTTMANVFTAKSNSDVKSEILKAVSVSFTREAGVSYTIEVYTNLTDANDPTSGVKQESATVQGITAYAGIYTIELADEVIIQPGSMFSIVVSADKAALDYEQAVSIMDESFTYMIWDCTVSQYNNKSFYKSGNNFYAYPWGNLCVKAFTSDSTVDIPVENIYNITYELNGGVNNEANPATYKTGNAAIELKAPSRSGYTFEGWYTDSSYRTKITSIPANSTMDYTLYAKWRQNLVELSNLEDGVYVVNSAVNNNLVFDIAANSSDNGANLEVWYSNGLTCQRFNIKKHNSDYTITAMHSGKCIGLAESANAQGTNVQQMFPDNGSTQDWKFYDAGDGYVYIRSESSGLYMTLDSNNAGGNISIRSYTGNINQKFILQRDETYDAKDDTALTSTSIDMGIYMIESAQNSSLVLDIAGNSGNDGANLEVWYSNGIECQRFCINQHDGVYTMKAMNSNKNIDVAGAASTSGTNVQQWQANGCNAQDWIFYDAGDGYVYIKSVCSGLYMTLDSNNAGGNVCIRPYTGSNNQKFRLWRDESYDGKDDSVLSEISVNEGVYVVESAQDASLVLDIAGNSVDDGANLEIWYRNGIECQRFSIKYHDRVYTMTAMNSGKNIDVAGAAGEPGTNVQQWQPNGCNAQDWKFYDAGDGYVYIKSECSGLYLTLDGNTAGGNICIRPYTGSANQKFRLNEYTGITDTEKNIVEGVYSIAAYLNNSLVVDIAANSSINGANVGLWNANGLSCQNFAIKYQGNGHYTIQPQNSMLYIDVSGAGNAEGTNVQQWEWTNCDAQLWRFIDAGDGSYYIEAKCNGLRFGLSGDIYAGANIAVYASTNLDNQKFVLIKRN